ncbi:MAG: twin-arginine translocase TatA/TatE family subunit [Bacteroidales bacterium]|nr:twin-arginine translocase TatA/TatE family subunit [Bacteroidales bacterium]MDD4670830.1 twin-arginine translocase TatA/TatE family subunit [Bacteroidales bacterium]
MRTFLLFGSIGWAEVLIVAFVFLLLFGGKKIPELMKGLGKGIRSFKDGMKDVEKDVKEIENDVKDIDSDDRKK